MLLWIAFNLWFDDLWHTGILSNTKSGRVVNCFQFVIWRSLTHPLSGALCATGGCELLSICDLTIFDTPGAASTLWSRTLWIAFNLWFDDLWHTNKYRYLMIAQVVNCFQFVIWRSLTHLGTPPIVSFGSCELLSICDLTIFDTPIGIVEYDKESVVNCFQFVIWRSLTHPLIHLSKPQRCCELLSICDLTIFDTPEGQENGDGTLLWIAFNLWFDDLWHTFMEQAMHRTLVVNCFQFVIWRSLTHRQPTKSISRAGCELLSICDLTIFDTPPTLSNVTAAKLWIAFNLWFDDLWHTWYL